MEKIGGKIFLLALPFIAIQLGASFSLEAAYDNTAPYTISVGALGVDGFPSPFDEECSAKMVTAYVTNYYGSSSVTTTELGGGCTLSFGGTSAATPMVSAIIALTLEANPDLTWRDVQYLIVYTSNTQLTNDSDSITNGAGLAVSRQYGFGVMDAEAMVTRARHWVNIPSQEMQQLFPSSDSGNATFESPFYTTIQYEGSIQYLEHVVITMTVDTLSGNRGDIMIELTSPSGTMSTLLDHRDNDYSSSGFINWPFMSVMFWGENPSGEWNLTVTTGSYYTSANITGIVFKVLGVSSTPQSVANIPGTCHPNCSRGCAGEGPDTCDSCTNLRNAYTLKCIGTCPAGFTERNGYCYDTTLPLKECYSPLKFKEVGSCVDAGFSGCCEGDNCEVFPSSNFSFSCFCDVMCFKYGDCCDDISITGCAERNDTLVGTVIPYIQLGVTEGVATRTVPEYDDGTSSPIYVSFPLGSQLQSTIYVGTNGYFTFTGYSGYAPFLFYENSLPLVAPFFTDIDISSGIGQINYEVHTEAISGSILSQVNSVINEHSQTDFKGKWMLVATWDQVPPFGDYTINNTFQGILITNTFTSFAVFTYYCGDLEYSNGATIGFSSGDGLFANHPASLRGSAQSVASLNEPATPWVNVVYELTTPGGLCLSSEGYFYSDTVGECIFIGDCACSRNIECSIHGGYDGNDPLKVIPNGKVLNCLLAFDTDQIDLETVEVDDTLETNHLFMSPGSLAFLENIGVAETRNDYSTCMFHEEVFSSLQSGSPAATLGEFGVETIQIQYMDNDGSFKSITLATVEFDQIIRDQNYAVDGNLSNDNACSLQHLLYWLATQPGIIGSGHSSGSGSGGIGEEAVGASGRGGRVIPVSVSDVICRQTDTGDTNIVFPVSCI